MRAFSSFVLLILVLIIPGSNACIPGSVDRVNIIKVDCKENFVAHKIKNTPNIVAFSSYCEDYLFREVMLREALGIFVTEYFKTICLGNS